MCRSTISLDAQTIKNGTNNFPLKKNLKNPGNMIIIVELRGEISKFFAHRRLKHGQLQTA